RRDPARREARDRRRGEPRPARAPFASSLRHRRGVDHQGAGAAVPGGGDLAPPAPLGNREMSKLATALQTLVDRLGINTYSGNQRSTDEAELASFEKRNKIKLPSDVREYFAIANGLTLRSNCLRLLSLAEAQEWLDTWGVDRPRRWGYVPIAD